MKFWTDKHEALLNALQSEALIPDLFQRLSGERLEASEKDVRVMRDWTASLQQDPGWAILGKVIDEPNAFPAAFHDAITEGFSPRTDHHNALVFGSICERLIAAQNYDAALHAWREAIEAWTRVYSTPYIDELVADMQTSLSEEEISELVRESLAEWGQQITASVDDPAGVVSGRVRRDELRFLWAAYSGIEGDGSHPAITHFVDMVNTERRSIDTKVVGKLEREFDAIDPTDATKDSELVALLEWFGSVYETVGYTDSSISSVIPLAVERCWALRKVGRDDAKIFTDILRILRPFNIALHERIVSGGLFGLNSKCADFLVFEGEGKIDQAARKKIFETGLDICPGHRNSAMLLSYVLLGEVDAIVLKLQVIPSARMMVRWGTQSIEEMVWEGYALLDRVQEIYPFNERYEDTAAKLDAESERLGVRE